MSVLTVFAKRFITGETMESAVEAVRRLNRMGMFATIDILGENVRSQQQATRAADNYINLLKTIAASGIDSHISIKLTQMGLDISDEFCFDNVSRILETAAGLKNFVRVDMEGSLYTERTLNLVYRWHEKYGNVGAVIQAYLYRSEADVAECIRRGISVRLCKGAYREPKEVAFQAKEAVNANFVKLAEMLLKSGHYPAIATHDGKMVEAAIDQANRLNKRNGEFEFQMLYGINRSGQRELVRKGYRMRIYTPFGTHWFPYYLRRLRERKENIFFIMRHFFRD